MQWLLEKKHCIWEKIDSLWQKGIAYDKKDNTLGKNGKVFGENDNAELMKGMTLDYKGNTIHF